MALYYQTEYCVGRTGRVRRTYSGVRAVLAIAFDLVLASLFGVIELALRLVRFVVMTAVRISVGLVTIPLKAARVIANHLAGRSLSKPTCAVLNEL